MTYDEISEHNQILEPSQTYCIYCWKNQNWKSKHQEWAYEADITNIEDEMILRVDSENQKLDEHVLNVMCLWHENLN